MHGGGMVPMLVRGMFCVVELRENRSRPRGGDYNGLTGIYQ